MTLTILRIDASARRENSVTRSLATQIISHHEAGQIIRRACLCFWQDLGPRRLIPL